MLQIFFMYGMMMITSWTSQILFSRQQIQYTLCQTLLLIAQKLSIVLKRFFICDMITVLQLTEQVINHFLGEKSTTCFDHLAIYIINSFSFYNTFISWLIQSFLVFSTALRLHFWVIQYISNWAFSPFSPLLLSRAKNHSDAF